TMASAKLDSLPFETLEQIAGLFHDTHRPSLYAFSLVNRICHSAALRSVFREVQFIVSDRNALQQDVDALVKILARTESSPHVRHLRIKGFLLLDTEESEKIGGAAESLHDESMNWFRLQSIEAALGDEEPFLQVPFREDGPVEVSPEEAMAWIPVVDFVKTLQQLTKLVYDCRNQFPPDLLDAIHRHHPQCKIHHFSLRWQTPDLHEMAIATSPCLYSVKVKYAPTNSDGEDDFNLEAMLELVAGLAPNLKEVCIIRLVPTLSLRRLRMHRIPRKPWRSLPGFISGSGTGSLTSLSLQGSPYFNQDFLRTWNKHTDFSCLRRLTLGGGFECYHGINDETMGWIVRNCSLPQLEALRVRLNRDDHDFYHLDYANNTIAFFEALPSLNELSVSGSIGPVIMDSILSRDGRTLRKLAIRPLEYKLCETRRHIPMIFTKEHILQIRAQCPVLQDLEITIKRTKSDAHEAEIYRSFGKMESLQRLFLTVDCSDWRVMRGDTSTDELSFDEDDRTLYSGDSEEDSLLRRGHVREAFMNCAVDETLARSIWETICRDKTGRKLETLKLYTTGGGSFGDRSYRHDISEIFDNLSRSWLIERCVRDDKDSSHVKELTGRTSEACNERATSPVNIVYRGSSPIPERTALHIFHRIWPRKDGSRNWREDWASLPLDTRAH
ncbi:hypothetical protein GQ53DRAFT_887765, partial [Thozetella sp. PMI_491]